MIFIRFYTFHFHFISLNINHIENLAKDFGCEPLRFIAHSFFIFINTQSNNARWDSWS